MTQQSYLLFDLHHCPYGIAADFVQEIFFLPALTDLAESEPDVAGILSLRGEILTVIDLNQRLGKPHYPFSLNHSVIVISCHDRHLGIIVDLVHGVETIDSADISQASLNGVSNHGISNHEISNHRISNHRISNPGESHPVDCPLLIGLAQYQEQIIPLLNPEALVKRRSLSTVNAQVLLGLEKNGVPELEKPEETPQERSKIPQKIASALELNREFMAEFNPHEQDVLRDRAKSLRHIPEGDNSSGLLPLAVVGLQGEYFGLNLERIHEFTEIHQITPIPCCPPHIVGNINLRGEILTLVDISQFLKLKGDDGHSTPHNQQAVVVRLDKLVAGVTVDTVHDVVYLHAAEISPVPAAVHAMNEDFIRGVASYQDKQMSILDLSKILLSDDLVVNEAL